MTRAQRSAAGFLLAGILGAGCAPSRLAVRPVRYDVDLQIDPREHRLEGQVSLELEQIDPESAGRRKATVELLLHPDLQITSLQTEGAILRAHKTREGRGGADAAGVVPLRHRLIVENPLPRLTVDLGYRGELHQDVAAGEEQGQVHNFAVSAHLGEEGLFLAPDGYFYPLVEQRDEADPELGLAEYRLSLPPVEGFELVVGLESDGPGDDGRLRWSSPFPLDGLVLLGGPLVRHSRTHDGVELHAVLAEGKESVAQDILDASAEYLDRYQTLIGPYPFREFTVLEAFFSSGFAFPTCTQIAGSQLSEYKQYRRHGYLDHELLHNWWGNGILVDPRDGNWCEGLASYMGNYYGHVLDGDEQGARKQRRNQSNFLSSIDPERDKPLGTFGQDDGAGRGIGYQKSAAVFHMLEGRIGTEAVFAGLRRLTDERMGRYSSWEHLQQAFEQESGEDLDLFFEQWVRSGGAPRLHLVDAEWSPGSERLKLTISQEPTEFTLDVPLRLHYGERTEDVVVTIDRATDAVELATEPQGLTAVELDPDYHVFRKLEPEEVMPTSGLTKRTSSLLVIAPPGELGQGYRTVVESYERAVLGDDEHPEKGHRLVRRASGDVDAEELENTALLVLGEAVRHPVIREFLGRTRSPVTWNDTGFEVEGQAYSDAREAVFFTVHHPDLHDEGVTVYYGNSEAALANARVLGYYPNSLLVFEAPEGADDGLTTGMPRTEVVRRIDFEFHDRIDF